MSLGIDIPAGRMATVIGGAGFIGKNLVERLVQSGWSCVLVKRNEIEGLQHDLGHVFYCAGLTADYAARPFETIDAHVSTLSRVLKFHTFESLVYLSSARLYDGCADPEVSEDSKLVLDSANPRHIYDLSKALGESLCQVVAEGRAKVVRLSCVYKDIADKDGFLPALLRDVLNASRDLVVKKSRGFQVDTSPSNVRDYIWMGDVLDALIMIATKGQSFIYNISSGENIKNSELFDVLSAVSGLRIEATRPSSLHSLPIVSNQKMCREFDWQPVRVLPKILELLRGDGNARID